MALSNELISQFAKMSKGNKRENKETTVYGTIVKINETKYVKIDGSDRLTPISSTTDALDGERVTVLIKDHAAIVNGNISSPAARTGTVDDVNYNISDTNARLLDTTALYYKVNYDESSGTYTLTDERISSDGIEDTTLMENVSTTTNEPVYSGKDSEGIIIYFSKIQTGINDIQDSVDINSKKISEAESAIQQLGDKIIITVKDEDGKTSLTQTSGDWTFNLNALNETVDDTTARVAKTEDLVGNADEGTGLLGDVQTITDDVKSLSDRLETQGEYIRFYKENGQPYLELGNSSNFKVVITNNEIQFLEGSSKVAYISNEQLYIEKSTIKQELEIGTDSGFIWKSRDNGNMGLQWFERSE